eukprot:gene13379-28365_t
MDPDAPRTNEAMIPLSFCLEDNNGSYRDVAAALVDRGWEQIGYIKRGSFEQKRMPFHTLFTWSINEQDIPFSSLEDDRIVNHFEGILNLTTKSGLRELLKEMRWVCADANHISPRCYNIGNTEDRDEFIEDFHISACINILKWVDIKGLIPFQSYSEVIHDVIIIILKYHEMNNSDKVEPRVSLWQRLISPLQWKNIRNFSYILDEKHCTWDVSLINNPKRFINETSLLLIRIRLILRNLVDIYPQFAINGSKNIWIVKPPETCRGKGIKIFWQLEDVLGSEYGLGGGRIAQKYIENPLLVPFFSSPTGTSTSTTSEGVVHHMKFDMRVWVLV